MSLRTLLESSCTADRCVRHIRRRDSCATATDEKSARIVPVPRVGQAKRWSAHRSASALRHLEQSTRRRVEPLAACVRESLCCTIRGSRQDDSTNESKERDVAASAARSRTATHTAAHTSPECHAECPSRWASCTTTCTTHRPERGSLAAGVEARGVEARVRERPASAERYGFAGVSRFLRPSPTRKTSLLWLRVASGRTTRHSA